MPDTICAHSIISFYGVIDVTNASFQPALMPRTADRAPVVRRGGRREEIIIEITMDDLASCNEAKGRRSVRGGGMPRWTAQPKTQLLAENQSTVYSGFKHQPKMANGRKTGKKF